MGFYHPHVIVEDAKRHDVTILPVDINKSYVRCTVENGALRLGFNYVHGVGDKALEVLEEAQLKGPVTSLEEFCRRIRLTTQSRNGLTRAQVQNLVLAGAFDALEPNRREAVWRFNEHADNWQRSPMLAEPSETVQLAQMTHRERVATDYRLLSVSTTDHLIHFYRPQFDRLRVIDSKTIRSSVRDGAKVRVGGLVITRQSPSTGKEFKFFTLADEFGHVDVILRPALSPGGEPRADPDYGWEAAEAGRRAERAGRSRRSCALSSRRRRLSELPQLSLSRAGSGLRVCQRMFWLVEPDPSAAGQGDLGHPAPARLVEGALERHALPFQCLGGGLDVLAEQVELVMLGLVGRMDGDLRGRQREDQPTAARIHRVETEHVLEKGAIGLRVAAEDHRVCPGDERSHAISLW